MRTIKQEWEEYFAKSYKGVPVSRVQAAEIHQAFFAGALCVLGQVIDVGSYDDEKKAREIFEGLLKEAMQTGQAIIDRNERRRNLRN